MDENTEKCRYRVEYPGYSVHANGFCPGSNGEYFRNPEAAGSNPGCEYAGA
jgi:hypothetical protein